MAQRRIGIFGGLLLAAALALSTASRAQETAAPPPDTLANALAQTRWNPAVRGPLLALDPERVHWYQSDDGLPRAQPLSPPPNGYDLAEIAPYFDHIIVRAGSLTALVPKTIRQLKLPTLTPEEAIPLERSTAGQALFASLTPAQWNQLTSADGLGDGDLTAKQRPLFFTILPRVFLWPSQPLLPDGRRPEPTPLGDDRRATMRLRLFRTVQLMFMPEGTDGNHQVSFGDPYRQRRDPEPPRDFFLQIQSETDDALTRQIAPRVSNRQKRSDLPFGDRTLNPPVALEGARTLGELVRRAAQATGLELIADARIAPLPLWSRGASARSGDALQALCRAVGGTFRRLDTDAGALYLLTYDREGLGALQARLIEWQQRVDYLRFQHDQERQKARRQAGPAPAIPYDDPYGLPESVHEKMEASRRQQRSGKPVPPGQGGIAVGDLPLGLQEFVRKTLAAHPTIETFEEGARQTKALRADRVMIASHLRLQVIVPDLGEVDDWSAGSYLYPLEYPIEREEEKPTPESPTAPLEAWRERALAVTPTTVEEAREAVRRARRAGIGALWLDVPAQAAVAKPLLEAALTISKDERIAVGALVHPFQVPADPLPEDADINILGETSAQTAHRSRRSGAGLFSYPWRDTVRTYREPTLASRKAQLAEIQSIAALPGLATLALWATAPPGYGPENAPPMGSDLGYSFENRIAFLRQAGCDPIDLSSSYDSRHSPPFFGQYLPNGENPINPRPAWNRLRQEKLAGWSRALFDALRAAAPGVRLWLSPDGGFFGLWEKADAKPAPNRGGDWAGYLAALRTFSPTIWMRATPWGASAAERCDNLRRVLADAAPAGGPRYDGVILDLTGQPIAEAFGSLDELSLSGTIRTDRR